MTIRFPFEQELTYLRSLVWAAIIFLPGIGWINAQFFPGALDPVALRGSLIAICLMVQLAGYWVNWARRNFRLLVYGLVLLGLFWVHYLLYLNSLSDRYVIGTIIILVGCSLVFYNSLHLKIYAALILFLATAVAVLVQDPVYPKVTFLSQIYLLVALDYIALRNLIRSNSQLSLSGQYLKALVDNVDASCCLMDPNGKIVKLNERLQKRMALETGKHLKEGLLFTDFISADEVELFREAFDQALTGEAVHVEKPVYINRKQATWLDLKFIPVPDPIQKRTFVLFHARDTHAIKASQERIKKQNEELQRTNQELDRFVYLAAHDLRAPLTSLLGLIDLARRENSLDALATYFDMMDESVQKLDRFINEVMSFSRNSRTEISREEIDFDKMISQIMESYQFIEGWDQLEKEIIVEGENSFYSDRRRLEIVFHNLISNAWKYRDADKDLSWVKIKVHVDSRQCTITVEDNGIGIAPRSLGKIFDLFYRINSKSSGSGLGLYIVRETLEKLQGSVTAESEQGKGSTFRVTIPNMDPRETVSADQKVPMEISSAAGVRSWEA